MSVALAVAVAPLVGGLLLVATMHWFSVFAWLIAENSLIESFQLAFLVASVALFTWIGIHLLRRRKDRLGLVYLAIALGAFFVLGEEISWGQTIFKWQPDTWLTRNNFQGETNLHTGIAHGPTVYGFILIAGYGAFVPLVASRFVERRNSVTYLLVPPLALVPAFFVPFAYRVVRSVFDPLGHIPRYAFEIDRFSEWGELSLFFGVLIVAVLTWRLRVRGKTDLHEPRSAETTGDPTIRRP